MRAVVIGAGGALDVVERPAPVPGGTELLVAVRAAGVNGADLAQRPGATRRRPAGRSTSPASRWPARS